jgi:hypothetical protein
VNVAQTLIDPNFGELRPVMEFVSLRGSSSFVRTGTERRDDPQFLP